MRGLFIVAIGLARTAGALSYNAPLSAVSRVSSPSMMAKSKALPFLEQPAHLDGSMAGDVGFDPLGLGSAYNMKWMREAELKHGRVCMLAFIGFCSVDLGFRAPGAPAVSSLAAHDVTVASGHMLALLITIGVFEFIGYAAIYEMLSGESDRAPGDYGFAPRARAALRRPARLPRPAAPRPHLTPRHPPRLASRVRRRQPHQPHPAVNLANTAVGKTGKYAEYEVAHCRAAMLAFGGVVTQSALTGKGFPYF